MEGLGKKLQEARLTRNLTLEEAGRLTKIRPSRLEEIENEDFSQFASLAYAKGFLLIYGKFLDVDVTPYLETFETSEHVTVDGYSYLQDNPAPKPTRPATIRPRSSSSSESRGSLVPFLIGVVVLIVGFTVMKWILDLQRLKPRANPTAPIATVSPVAGATPDKIIAPRALPVENTTPPPSPAAITAASQTAAVTTPVATPAPAEPEVRRAEPVRADDLTNAESTPANRLEIRALKKTYVKVVIDHDDENPAFERWMSPSEAPMQFHGKHIAVRVLDPAAVEIRKNGKRISSGDPDVSID
ncbi:MAG TPA: helix-turn-helix domain-containing protein [Chthoniobacterales bacterium]|jgi:cytoskeletal protein RodZ